MSSRSYLVLAKSFLGSSATCSSGLAGGADLEDVCSFSSVFLRWHTATSFSKKKQVLLCAGIIAAVLIIKSLLPVAGIEEGHNIFLVFEPGASAVPDDVKNGKDIYGNKIPSKEHDALMLLAQGKGVLQQSIPARIYNDWRDQFDKRILPRSPLLGMMSLAVCCIHRRHARQGICMVG